MEMLCSHDKDYQDELKSMPYIHATYAYRYGGCLHFFGGAIFPTRGANLPLLLEAALRGKYGC